MKIKVRTQASADIDIDIPDDSCASVLRPIVAERTGIEASLLRFIFQGHVLNDQDRLLDRGIKDGMTVLVVTRRPPGAADDTAASGGNATVNPPTTNLVNAEINILRSGFLAQRESALALVRRAVERIAAPLSHSLSWEVDFRENLPQQGDLTILVHLLGNETNHPSSGARARILCITDTLSRVILAMQVIKDELCQLVDDVVARNYSLDDESFARLDECVLRLEETLLVPRAGINEMTNSNYSFHQGQAQMPPGFTGTSLGRPASAPDTIGGQSSTQAPRNVTRHSTRYQYAQLLDHVIATQTDFITQIQSYQTILRNPQIFCSDEYARCLAQVFQEHVRRMFHCFGHIFHALSDISSSFANPEPDQLRPVGAEMESLFRTEAMFRIIALTGEESRIRTLGQQAAQAFRAATQQQQHHHRNIRMQLVGDVRLAPTLRSVTRSPAIPPIGNRFATHQSFVQFPPPTSSAAGPMDMNLLHRFWAQGTPVRPFLNVHTVSSTPAPVFTTHPSAPSSGANGSATSTAPSAPTTAGTRSTSSGQGQTTNILRQIFSETFNRLLLNRSGSTSTPATSSSATGAPTATSSTVSGAPCPTTSAATTSSATGATATGSMADPLATGSLRPRLSRSGSGSFIFQAASVQPSATAPTLQQYQMPFIPGMIGQVVVEADGPEDAQHILNAALRAATATATTTAAGATSALGPQHFGAFAAIPHVMHNRPVQEHLAQMVQPVGPVSMTPLFRGTQGMRMEMPGMTFQGIQLHATDRYLPCHSNFASPSSEQNRTRDYQGALESMRQAALRYERSLPENSEQRDEAELLTDRWAALRESDARHSRQILSGNVSEIGTMQNDPDQFERVLGTIIQRIVFQMAVTDPDIAEEISNTQNDFESYFNDLTNENRDADADTDAEGDVLRQSSSASTSQMPSAETASSSVAATPVTGGLPRISSEPTLIPQEAVGTVPEAESEGGGSRWTQELQVLRVLTEIMNAPGGATVGQFLRREGYQYTHTGGGFVSLLLTMVYEVLDTSEFMRLVAGDLSNFGSFRQQMRRYAIEHVLNDNSRPSAEDLENVSRRLQMAETIINRVFEADSNLRRLADYPGVGRIDVAASILNVDRIFIRSLLTLLLETNDGLSAEDFTKKIIELFAGFFRRFVAIANLSANSPTGYADVLMQLTVNGTAERQREGQSEGTAADADASNEYQLMRNLMEASSERLEGYLRQESALRLSDIVEELVLVDPAAEELSWSSDSAETIIAANSRPVETAEESDAGTLKNAENSVYVKNQPCTSASAKGNGDLNVFPESWITVIVEDICRQAMLAPQPALSEAYLSGDTLTQAVGSRNGDANSATGFRMSTMAETAGSIRKPDKDASAVSNYEETESAAMEIDPPESDKDDEKPSSA